MKTFYFNTGVRPGSSPLYGKQVWKDGTKQIPFDVEDVPEGAILMFLCDNPELPESKYYLVKPVFNTDMCSKYAYFRCF